MPGRFVQFQQHATGNVFVARRGGSVVTPCRFDSEEAVNART